jgi:predicted metal-dependent hydrolase
MALYIRDDGVEVRAPLRLAKAEIDRFVASKEDWIAAKLSDACEVKALRERLRVEYGSAIL